MNALINFAKDAMQLITEVPQLVAQEWKADLDLAMKGIVPRLTSKKAKPILNVEDV